MNDIVLILTGLLIVWATIAVSVINVKYSDRVIRRDQ